MNIKIKLILFFVLLIFILYSNFISIELKLSLLFGLVGLVGQYGSLINGLKKQTHLDCNLEWTIISRYFYDMNKSYYDLFRFALKDFYFTMVLLLYISFMITKFFGIHISNNKNISNYNKNDIIIIILLLFISVKLI